MALVQSEQTRTDTPRAGLTQEAGDVGQTPPSLGLDSPSVKQDHLVGRTAGGLQR